MIYLYTETGNEDGEKNKKNNIVHHETIQRVFEQASVPSAVSERIQHSRNRPEVKKGNGVVIVGVLLNQGK